MICDDNLIKISAVSYQNTLPFAYGLKSEKLQERCRISFDIPSECARKLQEKEVDLGLVPAAALLKIDDYNLISEFCIGSLRTVRTVVLLSNSPMEDIDTVYLDYQSRTSVMLTKILARHYWNKTMNWKPTSAGFENAPLLKNEAILLIGDRVFEKENSFRYKIDLMESWFNFTGLPFVFAVWASNKVLPADFCIEFDKQMQIAIRNIHTYPEVINSDYLYEYLTRNISYAFDPIKKKALKLFLELAKKTEVIEPLPNIITNI